MLETVIYDNLRTGAESVGQIASEFLKPLPTLVKVHREVVSNINGAPWSFSAKGPFNPNSGITSQRSPIGVSETVGGAKLVDKRRNSDKCSFNAAQWPQKYSSARKGP